MKNRIKCRLCGDIITSNFRHDFKKCRCGEIFIDGGEDYFRAGANDLSNIIPLYEEEDLSEEIPSGHAPDDNSGNYTLRDLHRILSADKPERSTSASWLDRRSSSKFSD